jgi:hypothetical protein
MAYFLSNWQYAELAKLLAVAESTLARVEDSIEGAP